MFFTKKEQVCRYDPGSSDRSLMNKDLADLLSGLQSAF